MKIKTKLFLGIGILFTMIALLTVLSTTYINVLSRDAENILRDNYNTIDYCRKMLDALNDGISSKAADEKFKENLNKQRATITEVGEGELTKKLADDYASIIASPGNQALEKVVRKDITDIVLLNMQAIQRKNTIASQTARGAIFWIAITGTFCFLCAFILLINLPSSIANPIKELTNSIKQIASKNYSERVHFESHGEFGELARSFNTMAKKLEEYSNSTLAKLMMEKKRIETLINNMSEPVIGLDEHYNVLFMNNIALEIAGLQKEKVIGNSVADIAQQNDLVKMLTQGVISTNENGKKIRSGPVKIYAHGKESHFEKEIIPIKITPTGEQEEQHIGDVILLQNITTYKELDFAKTNFIATVSHELKTPISAIKMSLQLLGNSHVGKLNAEQVSLIESMDDDTNRLLKITGELLNMTQVESGSIQINVSPTKPGSIVNYAISATKAAAEQKQIKFEVNIPEKIPDVLADSEKTAWVLTNLLSNAVRYSYEHSSISIQVSDINGKVRFSVTDTGQGISPQYIEKIFDRYFRIPGTKKEGTGLGLSISKEFIEAQGGALTVESDFGAGSIFSFDLKKA